MTDINAIVLRVQGPPANPTPKEYPAASGSYRLIHDRNTLALGEKYTLTPNTADLTLDIMRLCAPAKRAVDRMFETLPLVDMRVCTPHVIPGAMVMEVRDRVSVYEALVMLLSIAGAYEKSVRHHVMADTVDELFTDMLIEDRVEYTLQILCCVTSLVCQMLELDDCETLVGVGSDSAERLEREGPADGPSWVPGLVEFLRADSFTTRSK